MAYFKMVMINQFIDINLQVFQKDELKQILGDIQVSISLTPEQWGKILEQILLVVLILGRHVEIG